MTFNLDSCCKLGGPFVHSCEFLAFGARLRALWLPAGVPPLAKPVAFVWAAQILTIIFSWVKGKSCEGAEASEINWQTAAAVFLNMGHQLALQP